MKKALVIGLASVLLCHGQTVVRTLPTNKPTVLQVSVTKTASFSGTAMPFEGRELIITWSVSATDAGGTYDLYITTSDGVSTWDIAHFPQIAGTAGRYTAIVTSVLPQNVTTAAPGVMAQTTATLKTDTAGAGNGIKTLGAGIVRHGPWGRTIGYELVAAAAPTTGITYSVTVTAK